MTLLKYFCDRIESAVSSWKFYSRFSRHRRIEFSRRPKMINEISETGCERYLSSSYISRYNMRLYLWCFATAETKTVLYSGRGIFSWWPKTDITPTTTHARIVLLWCDFVVAENSNITSDRENDNGFPLVSVWHNMNFVESRVQISCM